MSEENLNIVAREKQIIKTSITGIAVNVLLSAFKAGVGAITGSIAVILDAVNNLSDALSSVVTIIGARIAGRKPDKKHPLGHGRAEYLSALIVAGIVLYAGITALVESIKKIIHPEAADYSVISLVIIAAAVLAKVFLGLYFRKQGKKVNSGALAASGTDALFDAVISTSVLVCAIINLTAHISLEAYVGVIIAAFIIKAGIEIMIETLGDILGKRADAETTRKIKEIIGEEQGVRGAYDLIVNNYGPDRNYASVHIELPDTMTVDEVDLITRRLERRVFTETGVILTGVGVYSYNTHSEEATRIREQIEKIVTAHEWALEMHGFYADLEKKSIRFDVVISFEISAAQAVETVNKEVSEMYPDYSFVIVPDVDVTD